MCFICLDFCISLHNDIITATRDIPPGNRIQVRLIRMADDFVIWSPKTNKKGNDLMKYRIKLENLRLTVRKSILKDELFNAYYNGLKKIPEIPFSRNMIRTYTKLSGETDLGARNFIDQGQLPECVYIVSLNIFT